MLALAKGADILVQVKANQPGLLAACEDLACHCTPTQCDVQHDKGHGRRVYLLKAGTLLAHIEAGVSDHRVQGAQSCTAMGAPVVEI